MTMKCAASNKCTRVGRAVSRGMCGLHYESFRKRRIATGEWRGYVPAGPVQEHMALLDSAGLNAHRVMQITGLPERTVRTLRDRQRVWAITAERILAVHPTGGVYPQELTGFVPVMGTRRRLQSLSSMGYTKVYLADRLGLTDVGLQRLMLDGATLSNEKVRVANAQKVSDLWRELQHVHPAPTRAAVAARNRARKLGWSMPFDWDEDDIDDPKAKPQKPKREPLAWLDDYRELRSLGRSQAQIAESLGIQQESLRQRLFRHGVAS